MLLRTEVSARTRLEAAKAPQRVARWVAGGHTREDRARRTDVALYVRARLGCEGWPDHWILGAFAEHDTAECRGRRDRGLRRLTVEETCARFAPPAAPKRATKREREAAELMALRERVAALEAAAAGSAAVPRGRVRRGVVPGRSTAGSALPAAESVEVPPRRPA